LLRLPPPGFFSTAASRKSAGDQAAFAWLTSGRFLAQFRLRKMD